MKKIYVLIFIIGVVAISCGKQFDQTPQSTASKNAVFGSVQGLDLYANLFYDNLPAATVIVRGDAMCDFVETYTSIHFIK